MLSEAYEKVEDGAWRDGEETHSMCCRRGSRFHCIREFERCNLGTG